MNVQNEDELPDTNHFGEGGKHNKTYCWLLQLIKKIILISRTFRVSFSVQLKHNHLERHTNQMFVNFQYEYRRSTFLLPPPSPNAGLL